jgi:microcystin degradation protein MlrC
MKALLAQFIFESNTFNAVIAGLDTFKQGGVWLTGEAEVREWTGRTESQLSGSMEILSAAGWGTLPVFAATCAAPAGRLSAECFLTLRETLLASLRAGSPADGMILHLHGAAAAIGEDDVEGHLIEMVRSELSFTGRLIVSLDLHANITRRMLTHADALTAYRTMPHTDFVETGRRAARLLLDDRPTVRKLVKIPAMIPPTDTCDSHGRFAEVLRQARSLEKLPGVMDVSLFPVQPWMDVEEMGSAVVATVLAGSDDGGAVKDLAESWYAQRQEWQTGIRSWKEILRMLAKPSVGGPWILVDTADATTGGSSGDSAEAVARLWELRNELPGEVLLHVADPEVAQAAALGAGEFQLGSQRFPVQADVLFTGEGIYRPRGKSYTGITFSMGRAAVLSAGKLRIVVCSRGSLCADPAFYECLGLDPEQALAVQVKSMMGWRAGYDAEASRGLTFDGPGCTSLDFARLPFTGPRRDLFPIRQEPPQPLSLWQSN